DKGMVFAVETQGKKVKSQTTGTVITLSGKKIAELTVVGLFGDDPLEQGAVGEISEGSLKGHDLSELRVKEKQQ
ncbi:curli production assembly protein CsgG, partial [Enterococcus hirae]